MSPITQAQQEALARAATRLQDWVGFRIDDRAEDLARLYRDSRATLAERLRYVYDSFLAGEPSVSKARASGADVALKQAIDLTIDELTNQVGAEATTSIQSLLGGQPSAVNRYLGKYLELPAAGTAYDLNPRWVLQELSTSVIGGGTYFDRLMNIGENMKSDLTKIVRQGLISGTDFDTIRDRTMTAFGVDKLPEPKFNAYGSVQTYKNEARRQWNLLMDDTGDEVGAMKIWWCILDKATTPGCAARHGYPTSRVGDDLPRHFNCRCQIVLMAEGTDLTEFQEAGEAWLAENGYPSRKKSLAMEAWTPAEHPRDDDGKFTEDPRGRAEEDYSRAKDTVDGRTVRGALSTARGADVDNMSSISASLGDDYEILDDIREVPLSAFDDDDKPSFYSVTEEKRVKKLAAEIKDSREISPLIVVIDKKGPYILEGGHRYDAMKLLKAKSFPALVVVDTSEDAKKEAWSPDEHPRDPNGRFSTSGAPALHTIYDWAKDAGGTFNGVQEFPNLSSGKGKTHPGFATLTDRKTGSTTLLPINKDLTPELIKQNFERMRKTHHKETEAVQWGEHQLTLIACEEADTVEAWDADYRGSAAWRYQVVPWRALPQLVRTGVTGAFSAPSLLEAYRRSDPSSVVLRFPQVPGPTPARRVQVLAEAGWVPLQPKGAHWVEIRPGAWIADSPSWTRWQEAAVRLSPDVIGDFPQLGTLALRAAPPYRVSVQAGSPAGPNPDTWPAGTDSGPNLPALVDAALAAPLPADPLLGISDRNGLAVVVGLNGRVWYARDSFQGLGLSTYTRVAACCPGSMPGTVWAVKPVNHGQWVLPGGHVDKGETREQAVVREMREETGVPVRVERYLGAIHRPWATTHVYLVRADYEQGADTPSTPDEIAAARLMPVDDLDPSERVWLVQQDLTQEAWDPADHPRDEEGQFSSGGGASPVSQTKDEFKQQNPHAWHEKWDRSSRAGAFDKLPDDADVWVFHGTDKRTAEQMLSQGIRPEGKPRSLGRERYERGEDARFGPGAGLGTGAYVGSDPFNVEGYGPRVLAIRVKKKDLAVSPEQATLGSKSLGDALSLSDAQIMGHVSPANIFDVSAKDITSLKAYDAIQRLAKKTQEAWDEDLHPRGEGGEFADKGGGKTKVYDNSKGELVVEHGDTALHALVYDNEVHVETIGISPAAQAKTGQPFTAGENRPPKPGETLRVLRTFVQHVREKYPDVDTLTTIAYHPSVEKLMRRLGAEETGEDTNGKLKFSLDMDNLRTFLRSKEAEAWDEDLHPRDEEGQFSAGGGTPAAFGRMKKEDIPGDGSTSGPPGEHLFHTTAKHNLEDIITDGLQPQDPSYRGEQDAWPDGGDEGRVYFATRAAGALKFSEPDHVLLRVKKPDKLRAEFKDEDYYTRAAVRPDDVEVLGEDKQWHPLTTRKQEAWDEELHPRAEDGEFTSAGGGGAAFELPEDQRAAMQKKFAKRLSDEKHNRSKGLDNDTVLYAFGAPIRAADQSPATWAMADHIAKATDDDTMLNVLHSQNTWSLNWAGATREWRAADAAGGNGTYSRATKDAFEDPERFTSEERKKTRPLEEKEQKAFEARQQFVQLYFRKKYGDEVVVYRGIRGPQAKKIKENFNSGDEIDLPVYGLSSWSTSVGQASDFAMSGKGSRQKFTGIVVKTTVKPEDVWTLPRDLGPKDVIRFSEDHGEVVTLNKGKTRKVTYA